MSEKRNSLRDLSVIPATSECTCFELAGEAEKLRVGGDEVLIELA